jgi:hypothetical protein
MPEFLVELYGSQTDTAAVAHGANRAQAAAAEVTREGTPVRYMRSIFVPEDETCFYLYEASSVEAVEEAVRRAGLTFERVAGAVTQSN